MSLGKKKNKNKRALCRCLKSKLVVLENKSGPWDAGERNCSELKLGNKRRNRKRGKKIIALKASLLPRDSAEQSTKMRLLALCAPPGALLGTSPVLQASSPAAFKTISFAGCVFILAPCWCSRQGSVLGAGQGLCSCPGARSSWRRLRAGEFQFPNL